ncbi:unnamed protein product [Closterium sp. Naga37s-1]|nr:unnamed protein product [Closterium sp. Naga37s-1]
MLHSSTFPSARQLAFRFVAPRQFASRAFPKGRVLAEMAGGSAPSTSATHDEAQVPKKQISSGLAKFGPTVFAEFSALAAKHGAVNLGQGFPNFDGPSFVIQAAQTALQAGNLNQYAPVAGVPALTAAIASRFAESTGVEIKDPAQEITVTCGCTEAIAATILGLVDEGDEVVVFEPFYDSYIAMLSLAGAVVRPVTLRPPTWQLDEQALRAAFQPLKEGARTRAVLINTPHNPTGKVFSRAELQLIAELCQQRDTIAVSDEVYHKLVYKAPSPAAAAVAAAATAAGPDSTAAAAAAATAAAAAAAANEGHISIASLPGMYSRTVTLNSLGKTYSLTGWKVGWAVAPPHLTWGLRQAHSFLTFSVATPLQHGAVAALEAPEPFYEELEKEYRSRRDVLVQGLLDVGFTVFEPEGTYFIMADHTRFNKGSDVEFCRYLVEHVGVAAIPPSSFYLNVHEGRNLVRFAFCKDEDTLREAVRRMKEKLVLPPAEC